MNLEKSLLIVISPIRDPCQIRQATGLFTSSLTCTKFNPNWPNDTVMTATADIGTRHRVF